VSGHTKEYSSSPGRGRAGRGGTQMQSLKASSPLPPSKGDYLFLPFRLSGSNELTEVSPSKTLYKGRRLDSVSGKIRFTCPRVLGVRQVGTGGFTGGNNLFQIIVLVKPYRLGKFNPWHFW